ncbi:acyl carrier protein [Alkalilimnicola ehrlichii]|uniref:Carrier domain-containing protein n=1 Tax=Alkalilimnicola ehrlichii TaxID=351052 RepID=A0A3E0WKT5_9GAMM|nr:phosphopantetheine-binding protein [Alkalilimnicola ehrlichii]RFA33570.1 hypothetical protein CAL65_17100 [Alkalilimnicola ehrlichii]
MSDSQGEPNAAASEGVETRLLTLIARLSAEVRSGPPGQALPPITLDSHLERDLGLDSLARAELLTRIDTAFNVTLPEDAFHADSARALMPLIGMADMYGDAVDRPPRPLLRASDRSCEADQR